MSERIASPATGRAASPPAGEVQAAPARLAWLLTVVEWALLLAAIGLWVASKGYAPRMDAGGALVAGSWVARWLRTGRVTQPTPLDLPLGLFLISAVVATLIAPDRSAALVRLYLFLGAAALFYTLVNSSAAALRVFINGFILLGAALSLYFTTQQNWVAQPAKFAVITSIGRRLNQMVPNLGFYLPHPNVVAGLLALAFVIAAAWSAGSLRLLRNGNSAARLDLTVGLIGGLIIAGGLVMTSSRTSWLAAAGALALAGWWWAVEGRRQKAEGESGTPWIFWAGISVVGALMGVAAIVRPQLLTSVLGSLPGPSSVVSRVEVYQQVWRLAQDTPFTGGGLDAFPALYSTYILSIPYNFLTHAHNVYLQILVEQGWPGLIGYVWLLGAALWAASHLARQTSGSEMSRFVSAGALGLAAVVLHGLSEGSLAASRVTPILFVPAGLLLAALPPGEPRPVATSRLTLSVAGAAALVVALAVILGWRQWQAAWHANLGVLAYERIELAGWPTNQWDDGSRLGQYAAAEPQFEKALEYQPGNRTAHQRLGSLAALRRDYSGAVSELEQAYAVDPHHRGVIKSLGYAYAWLGEYDRAVPLLAAIPEAHSELEVYVWWWTTQGRPELSERAQEIMARLGP